MKYYTNFTQEQIRNWRPVPLSTVVKVANACNRGSDYIGRSKDLIYEDFSMGRTNGGGRNPNIKLFTEMMNVLTSLHCRAADKLSQDVNSMIRELVVENKP